MGSDDRSFEFTAVGDVIISRKLFYGQRQCFDRLVDLVRGTDAAALNLEHPVSGFSGFPAPSHGIHQGGPGWVVDDLTRMGFDLFALATNHAWDYTYQGVLRTIEALEARSIAHAGVGRTLSEAREPAYVDTESGRVALISTCSTFPPGSVAGMQRSDFHGRPGISPLRLRTRHVLRPEHLEMVEALSRELGLEEMKPGRVGHGVPPHYAEDDAFYYLDVSDQNDGRSLVYEAGEEPGIQQEAREEDVAAIEREIDAANRHADWVFVSLHSHEGPNGAYNGEEVAPFIQRFARRCVDRGADGFLGHGPHILRGVEIYEGAPLFYSLGNFVLQHPTIARFPAETYENFGLDHSAHPSELHPETIIDRPGCYESVLPVCQFDGDEVSKITFHPLDLGQDRPYPAKGTPRIADDTAEDVIEQLGSLSARFGTSIRYEDGVGVLA